MLFMCVVLLLIVFIVCELLLRRKGFPEDLFHFSLRFYGAIYFVIYRLYLFEKCYLMIFVPELYGIHI